MLFSSNTFLFGFLPVALLVYFLLPKRNLALIFISLVFYFWGSGEQTWILISYIAVNFALGLAIEAQSGSRRKLILTAGIAFNLAMLIYFKYANFAWTELSRFYTLPAISRITLPIGISFFTFQAISYLVEVHRREHPAERKLERFALFLSLFPHLVAGPVVRYSDISNELKSRTESFDEFFAGFVRFTAGLAKKILIATPMGLIADKVFNLPQGELTPAVAWIGAFAYTFQIYFDFSGYSDMAIGLAHFFGFKFPENFDQPYTSSSITEFWRRWHMSLSRWFRDFLYIPLGGNRKGPARTYFNLFVVFALCGLWHGASWTFVIWGLYHGVLLVIERALKSKCNFEPSGILGRLVTLLLVLFGWVFFRATSFSQATSYLASMFGRGASDFVFFPTGWYLQADTVFYFAFAFIFSCIKLPSPNHFLNRPRLVGLVTFFIFLLGIVYMSTRSFTPFIYFRF